LVILTFDTALAVLIPFKVKIRVPNKEVSKGSFWPGADRDWLTRFVPPSKRLPRCLSKSKLLGKVFSNLCAPTQVRFHRKLLGILSRLTNRCTSCLKVTRVTFLTYIVLLVVGCCQSLRPIINLTNWLSFSSLLNSSMRI